jgi:hypothetical protein
LSLTDINNRKIPRHPHILIIFHPLNIQSIFGVFEEKYNKQGNCTNTISFEQSSTYVDKIGYHPIGIKIHAIDTVSLLILKYKYTAPVPHIVITGRFLQHSNHMYLSVNVRITII